MAAAERIKRRQSLLAAIDTLAAPENPSPEQRALIHDSAALLLNAVDDIERIADALEALAKHFTILG